MHRRPGGPAVTYPGVPAPHTRTVGGWPAPAPPDPVRGPRGADTSALRTGLTAAAIAGGALAVAGSVVAVAAPVGQPPVSAVEPATVLRLAVGDAPTAQPDRPRTLGVAAVAAPPATLDVVSLVKAVGLAEAAARAEQAHRRAAARAAATSCDADLDGLGPVKPWARNAARFLSCLYDEPDLGGVAGRGGRSDHPNGFAVDVMARGERGDRIAACVLANRKELGVDYVLWKQRANYGDGWERMPDRGDDTANHRDHVHISFDRSAPSGNPAADRCR